MNPKERLLHDVHLSGGYVGNQNSADCSAIRR